MFAVAPNIAPHLCNRAVSEVYNPSDDDDDEPSENFRPLFIVQKGKVEKQKKRPATDSIPSDVTVVWQNS